MDSTDRAVVYVCALIALVLMTIAISTTTYYSIKITRDHTSVNVPVEVIVKEK